MKKFLSLVLALVMTMSLVTVSAGAKEFKDDADVTYDEAVAVISEVGVVDGYEDGSFKPSNTLTRGAAAKIICNLILGPTTAAELRADTAPYKDVPVSNVFSGYIAYCAKEGIISGYADGSFRPAGTLTGYAFMKMLLGALGYDSANEGYTGANWSIAVAKQAIGIGLNAGLVDEFNGVDFVTREEAALYAFNTLKATMVDYEQKITTTINGVEVVISQGEEKPVTWTQGINEDGNIKRDGFVQFAEEFFPKLECRKDSDDFMRPANNWVYDKTDIGTYVDRTLLVETYTEGVSGKEIYDLLKSGVIDKNKLESYVDGKDNTIKKNDLVRSNNNDLTATGNGVVTEVYLDSDEGVITIVSVNSYLAKATADYSESKEYAPLNVYVKDADGRNYNVDVEDVANVVDVKNDTFYQVSISYKDNASLGEVKSVSAVEVLEDSTVTKFSTSSDKVSKVTIGGEEYKGNVKAFYDKDVLNEYNENLLTDNTYTVYVDANGYFLGIELFEGTKNYVFIPGFDLNGSNIAYGTADASAIFLDGTMKTIKVNVKDTNDNIAKVNAANADNTHQEEYFQEWGKDQAETPNLNLWFTYTVDKDGAYTLKPAVRMTKTAYNTEEIIKTSNLSVKDNVKAPNVRVYGEDATVFLTVDLDTVSNGNKKAITDVDGVYTGVQSVEIEIDTKTNAGLPQVYTVYDSDYYVVGAVVIGEANGSGQNLAYILSGAKSEEKKDDTYYWTFEAVLNGEIQTLTAKSKYSNTISPLRKGEVMELRFDGDYVTKISPMKAEDLYTNMKAQIDGEDVYQMIDLEAANTTLNLQGRTMYITENREDVGLAIGKDAKAVVIQTENNKTEVKSEFASVNAAISHLADANIDKSGTQYKGDIFAALDSNGVAKWVVFVSDTPLNTGAQGGDFTDNGSDTTLPSTTDLFVDFAGTEKGNGRYDAKNGKLYLQFTGLTAQASKVSLPGVYVSDAVGNGRYVNINGLDVIKTTNLDGTTSKVYVMDYKATELSGTVILGNKITVNAATEVVDEWYVKYVGDTNTKFVSKQETVANVKDSEIKFSLGLPTGAVTATYADNTSVNVTMPAFAAIKGDADYTAKLTNAGTAPVVKVKVNSSAVVTDQGTGSQLKPVNSDHEKIVAAYTKANITTTVNGNTITAKGWTEDSLKALSADDLTAMSHSDKLYVGVQFTAPKTASATATLKSYKLDGQVRDLENHEETDFSNGTLYEWFKIADYTSSTVSGVVTGRNTHSVELVWELDGVEIVKNYTVVIGG